MSDISEKYQTAFDAIESLAQRAKRLRPNDAELKDILDGILSTCRYKLDVTNELKK